jgi:hypothetical protein
VSCTSSTTCTATAPGHTTSAGLLTVPITATAAGYVSAAAGNYTYTPQPKCNTINRTSTGVEVWCASNLTVYIQSNVSGVWHTVGTGTPGGGGWVDINANLFNYDSTTFRTCSDSNGAPYCNDPQTVNQTSCVSKSCDTVSACGPVPDGCGGTMTCNTCGNGTTCQNGQCVGSGGSTGSFCQECRKNGGRCIQRPNVGWQCEFL